jgi:hypothetical protein
MHSQSILETQEEAMSFTATLEFRFRLRENFGVFCLTAKGGRVDQYGAERSHNTRKFSP